MTDEWRLAVALAVISSFSQRLRLVMSGLQRGRFSWQLMR
jgi:hypothetical protein